MGGRRAKKVRLVRAVIRFLCPRRFETGVITADGMGPFRDGVRRIRSLDWLSMCPSRNFNSTTHYRLLRTINAHTIHFYEASSKSGFLFSFVTILNAINPSVYKVKGRNTPSRFRNGHLPL